MSNLKPPRIVPANAAPESLEQQLMHCICHLAFFLEALAIASPVKLNDKWQALLRKGFCWHESPVSMHMAGSLASERYAGPILVSARFV